MASITKVTVTRIVAPVPGTPGREQTVVCPSSPPDASPKPYVPFRERMQLCVTPTVTPINSAPTSLPTVCTTVEVITNG